MVIDQRPVELILARGLMANITTSAFLVDSDGTLAFFNDAAGDEITIWGPPAPGYPLRDRIARSLVGAADARRDA